MNLTFVGAALAGAACSQRGEVVVVDNDPVTTALSATLTGLTGTLVTTTATTTATTSASAITTEIVIASLEAHKLSAFALGHSVHVSALKVVVDLQNALLLALSGLDLLLDLLMLSGLELLAGETLGVGLLLSKVVIESETNFLFLLNDLLGLFAGLGGLFLLLFNGSVLSGLASGAALSGTIFAGATVSFAGTVASVHGVGILAGLAGEAVAMAASGGTVGNWLAVLIDLSSSGPATATAAAVVTSASTTAISAVASALTTAATVATFATIAVSATATTTAVTTAASSVATTVLFGSVVNALKFALINSGLV